MTAKQVGQSVQSGHRRAKAGVKAIGQRTIHRLKKRGNKFTGRLVARNGNKERKQPPHASLKHKQKKD